MSCERAPGRGGRLSPRRWVRTSSHMEPQGHSLLMALVTHTCGLPVGCVASSLCVRRAGPLVAGRAATSWRSHDFICFLIGPKNRARKCSPFSAGWPVRWRCQKCGLCPSSRCARLGAEYPDAGALSRPRARAPLAGTDRKPGGACFLRQPREAGCQEDKRRLSARKCFF